jgi:hypothetical protein
MADHSAVQRSIETGLFFTGANISQGYFGLLACFKRKRWITLPTSYNLPSCERKFPPVQLFAVETQCEGVAKRCWI